VENLLGGIDGIVLGGKEGVDDNFIGTSDGNIVGSFDIPAEGTSLGVIDGFLDGENVKSDGSVPGFALSASLTLDIPLGTVEGHAVGEFVCGFVNRKVGAAVGEIVGVALGAMVGNSEGILLGIFVGKNEGDIEQYPQDKGHSLIILEII